MRENYFAISGKIGSGKTTIANGLVSQFGFQRRGFADAIKESVAQALGCPAGDVYSQKQVFRSSLQAIGQAGRAYWGEDYWVRKTLEWIENAEDDVPHDERDGIWFVLDDLRFPNEAVALKGFGFTLVRIEDDRESHLLFCHEQGYTSEEMEHVSETALDSWTKWDMVVAGRPRPMGEVFASFLAAAGLAEDFEEALCIASSVRL